ncbi:hypothetical protein ACSS6W_004809 [Trichoderma asperelloides]
MADLYEVSGKADKSARKAPTLAGKSPTRTIDLPQFQKKIPEISITANVTLQSNLASSFPPRAISDIGGSSSSKPSPKSRNKTEYLPPDDCDPATTEC